MEQHNTCHWKICIDKHDVLGMLLLLFLFLHRNVPLDNSSLWQVGVLCVIYLLSRQLDKRFILIGIAVWSTIESLLAILQKLGYIFYAASRFFISDVGGQCSLPLQRISAVIGWTRNHRTAMFEKDSFLHF